MSSVKVQAHRGASAYAPENTMAAFKMAVDMGTDGIELDVQMTADGEVVVIHDLKVDRTSNGKGLIKDMSLKELKALDFGSWFDSKYKNERIPLLEEVMELVSSRNVFLNIELKATAEPDGMEMKVIDLIHKFKMGDSSIVSSFNHYSLVEIKRIDPTIKTGVLFHEIMYMPWDYAKKLKADAIHPFFRSIVPDTIQNCINNNVMVNTWTVDEPEEIMRLASAGVTGIITNKPDVALSIVRA